jgi:hypothetical protein
MSIQWENKFKDQKTNLNLINEDLDIMYTLVI